jgi:hypothetical protein
VEVPEDTTVSGGSVNVSAVSVRLFGILQHASLFVAYFHTLISLISLRLFIIRPLFSHSCSMQNGSSPSLDCRNSSAVVESTRYEQPIHYTKTSNRVVLA